MKGIGQNTADYTARPPTYDDWNGGAQAQPFFESYRCALDPRPGLSPLVAYSIINSLLDSDEPASQSRAPIARNRVSIPGLLDRHESGAIPLASHGAAPAGSADHHGHHLDDDDDEDGEHNQSWRGFDEDDEEQLASSRPTTKRRAAQEQAKASGSKLWERVQEAVGLKDKPLTGERTVHVNDAAANVPFKFKGNYVSTSKYNIVTFIPKFLFGEKLSSFFHALSDRQGTRR